MGSIMTEALETSEQPFATAKELRDPSTWDRITGSRAGSEILTFMEGWLGSLPALGPRTKGLRKQVECGYAPLGIRVAAVETWSCIGAARQARQRGGPTRTYGEPDHGLGMDVTLGTHGTGKRPEPEPPRPSKLLTRPAHFLVQQATRTLLLEAAGGGRTVPPPAWPRVPEPLGYTAARDAYLSLEALLAEQASLIALRDLGRGSELDVWQDGVTAMLDLFGAGNFPLGRYDTRDDYLPQTVVVLVR